jgi:hypothetical protein
MAKPKKDKTAVQKTADAAREAFQKAKTAGGDKPTAPQKAAIEKAQAHMREAIKAENRERFLSIGVSRTKNARAAIRQLVKVFNFKTYEFLPEEGVKIVNGLRAAVTEVETALKTATSGTGAAATSDDFSL